MRMRRAFLTLTSLSLFISVVADLFKQDTTCSRQLDGLYPTGLCEQRLLYCENGRPTVLFCPPRLIFNPNSKFCEMPEELSMELSIREEQPNEFTQMKSPAKTGHLSIFGQIEENHLPFTGQFEEDRPPFVGEIEEDEDHPPFVGQIEEDEDRPPFVGQIEDGNDNNDDEFLPPMEEDDDDNDEFLFGGTVKNIEPEQKPFMDKYFEQHPREDQSSELAPVVDKFLGQNPREEQSSEFAPIVDKFLGQNPREEQSTEFAPTKTPTKASRPPFIRQNEEDNEWIQDQFLFGGTPKNIEPDNEQKPLTDKFLGKPPRKEQSSDFAPFNSPAGAGHDSFKVIPTQKVEQSEFAPLNSPVGVGHDVFNVRTKRSATDTTNEIAKCKQLIGIQMTNLTLSSMSSCTKKLIPHGCRPYYLSCVNGRPVQRFCPAGLFFNADKESCDFVQHIRRCVQIKAHPLKSTMTKSVPRRFGPSSWMMNRLPHNHKMVTPAPVDNIGSSIQTTPSFPPLQQVSFENLDNKAQSTETMTTSTTATTNANLVQHTTTSPPHHYQHVLPTDNHLTPTHSVHARPSYVNFFPERFCSGLIDGFYRHPKDCSRIVQCFANKLFEYPPCQHDLAFNERTGICDYKSNVMGCTSSPSSFVPPVDDTSFPKENTINATQQSSSSVSHPLPLASNGCQGHAHGDHLEDPADCTRFRRCVFGHLLPMSCPGGTVFNSKLSVCDYPGHVPRCRKQ